MASTEEAVEPGAEEMEGFGRDVQHLLAYFYVDDRIITSTQLARLQQAFTTLTYILELLSLCTNVSKMMSMACHPCHTIGD